ncbi:MAG: filamentous hemagglutinin N-terminal domain-containing protein, partial [Alphaproteobacteria bacterium]|nr:filamentous hemagglutinin N-terminal domain-containing protein [Alphaproteobacteria bacterium]
MAATRNIGTDSAKRKSKRARELRRRWWRTHTKKAVATSSAFFALLAAQSVYAAPQGGEVVHGSAAIESSGAVTNITTSNKAIINWHGGFDIAANETVNFIQPSAMSKVLNRIDNGNPTEILGSLNANGKVYIFNSAGIMFGEGSQVNVNALYAAGANITNEDFLNNVDRFTNVTGQVVNYGTIQANTVALIGSYVANHGDIVTPANGFVTMVAGDDILLSEKGGHIFAKITGGAGDAGVENTGNITSGEVTISAGDFYSIAIHNSGSITAPRVVMEGGATGTVWNEGLVDASSAEGVGGTVQILGADVAHTGTINADGATGGGTVLIGGDYQGSNPDVRNADRTYVDGEITANATIDGDGGTIVVWSDSVTQYAGQIAARGAGNGEGGFAE